jgi:hypothetical protein
MFTGYFRVTGTLRFLIDGTEYTRAVSVNVAEDARADSREKLTATAAYLATRNIAPLSTWLPGYTVGDCTPEVTGIELQNPCIVELTQQGWGDSGGGGAIDWGSGGGGGITWNGGGGGISW